MHDIPYYRVINGQGYCRPSLEMKKHGQTSLACGPDGEKARGIAKAWYERWLELKARIDDPTEDSFAEGSIVFLRTEVSVQISFLPRNLDVTTLLRFATGKSITSIAVVKGTKRDEVHLHQKLSKHQSGTWFLPTADVLEEMRLAIRDERIAGAPEAGVQMPTTGAPRKIGGRKGAYTSDVTDEQWLMIVPILAERAPTDRRSRSPSRQVINAILHHLRSKEPWTRLPDDLPAHTIARLAHRFLVAKHKWDRIESVLKDAAHPAPGTTHAEKEKGPA